MKTTEDNNGGFAEPRGSASRRQWLRHIPICIAMVCVFIEHGETRSWPSFFALYAVTIAAVIYVNRK